MLRHCILYFVFVLLFLFPHFVFGVSRTETISVPAGTTRTITFQLSWGDTVKGVISVSGGILHPGVDISVTDPLGNTILNMGRVTGTTQIEFSGGFIRGSYELRIVNPSWLSEKTVTITYDLEINPLMHYNYEIIAVVSIMFLVTVSVLLYKRAERKKKEKIRICPYCGQKTSIENTMCTFCGFDISRSVKCKYCNTFYDHSLPKCPNCGAKKE